MSDTEEAVVSFGFNDEEKKTGGRRAKLHKELKKKQRSGTFESMGLGVPVLRAIKRQGFRLPTPIQRRAMPLIMQGVDLVGMARTGSGKTAAFVIPMLEKLKEHSPRAGARAVILAPTRELALQTHKTVRDMAKFTNLRTAVLVGGDAMEAQFAELAQNPDIIVATPGRLLHHLAEVEGLSLRTVEYLVLDEADRMFEMGFKDQVLELIGRMSDRRQSLLFSATMPKTLAEFAQAGLQSPQLVRLDVETKISPDLKLAFFTVRPEEKLGALVYLVREVVDANQPTIMFVATRHHVEFLHNLFNQEGIPAACVFGSMDQTARKIHVAKFRAQKVNLLITTDVAARGIDIPLIDNVINLDFPPKPELFVHRVGRAARAGRSGTAYSLLTREELPYLLDLHLYLGRRVQACPEVPDLAVSVESVPGLEAGADLSLYGTFPQSALDPVLERLREVQESSPDLADAQKSISNAYSLYLKTRPTASPESNKRAKQLPLGGIHPLLLAAMPKTKYSSIKNEAVLADFANKLRSFRPAATVLEAEIAHVKSTFTNPLLDASSLKSKSNEVMNTKRQQHARIIMKERKRKLDAASDAAAAAREMEEDAGKDSSAAFLPGPPGRVSSNASKTREAAVRAAVIGDGLLSEGRFRDQDLYISHVKDGTNADESFTLEEQNAELQAAIMDLTAEDKEGMADQSRKYHWDKRHKRYVQLGANETVKGGKRMKNESGKSIDFSKGTKTKGLYQKWVKATHQKIATSGAHEDTGLDKSLSNRFHPSMRHKSWKVTQTPMRGGDLRSKDSVRKEREKTEQRKEWLQKSKSSERSGGRGGRGGSRGRGKVGRGGADRGDGGNRNRVASGRVQKGGPSSGRVRGGGRGGRGGKGRGRS
ncbi:hypothetical protein CEUSTIGMA_g9903.t1 [Chlamydomonas eustigma]|uniref:RNA helicase n=1 Tax=Chlamydomonas eustigma TaxID=1157962 RepID=A0A250XHI3_9CHLO|nr:hypothetical protein CEUSTIGMA_g9903.t1 [Chlamydomonas eustigma]|eukprot:GAX82476.1 hypothetical protein CEUSTIGMA_g9903.t1 [Chlamydomonas eustigma]